ncbi:MAG TPA: hypothetical protein VNN72_18185 [Polyangiaceae bacterium]|nr:hypothetical protein [Polyangiaceae bacterium]
MTTPARLLSFFFAAAIVLVGPPALAEDMKLKCIQANTDAQSLRREGKLSAAREQLRMCSESKCPSLVSADCIKRLDELENAQPTVIFDVFDASGHELNEVTVTVDGRNLLDRLGGTAVAVDLGEHVVTFAVEGRPAVTQKLTFREGEKSRHVRVAVADAPGSAAAVAPAAEPAASQEPASTEAPVAESSSPAAEGSGRTQRTVGYVVGGVGLAGLAAGGIFGYLTIAAKHRQTDNCSSQTKCPDYETASDAHEDAKTFGTISTVAFIAGGAATVAGAVLVLTAKPTHSGVGRPGLALRPSVAAGGAGITLLGAW